MKTGLIFKIVCLNLPLILLGCKADTACKSPDKLSVEGFVNEWNSLNSELTVGTFSLPNWDTSSPSVLRYSLDGPHLSIAIDQSKGCIESIYIRGTDPEIATTEIIAWRRLLRVTAPEITTEALLAMMSDLHTKSVKTESLIYEFEYQNENYFHAYDSKGGLSNTIIAIPVRRQSHSDIWSYIDENIPDPPPDLLIFKRTGEFDHMPVRNVSLLLNQVPVNVITTFMAKDDDFYESSSDESLAASIKALLADLSSPVNSAAVASLISSINQYESVSKLYIVSHTDNSSGSEQKSQDVSYYRAKALELFLSEHFQNSAIFLSAVGSSTPVATNSNINGRNQNNRIEIYIEN